MLLLIDNYDSFTYNLVHYLGELGAESVVALAAGLGPAARYRRWLAALRGQAKVVIGTRSAAFAPVRNIGLRSYGTTATTTIPNRARRIRMRVKCRCCAPTNRAAPSWPVGSPARRKCRHWSNPGGPTTWSPLAMSSATPHRRSPRRATAISRSSATPQRGRRAYLPSPLPRPERPCRQETPCSCRFRAEVTCRPWHARSAGRRHGADDATVLSPCLRQSPAAMYLRAPPAGGADSSTPSIGAAPAVRAHCVRWSLVPVVQPRNWGGRLPV